MTNSEMGPGAAAPRMKRRAVLGSAVAATSLGLLPLVASSAGRAAEARTIPQVLPAGAQSVLEAFVDRLVPADDNGPGALGAGVPDYINRSLSEWNAAELPELTARLEALDAWTRERHGEGFAELDEARRDDVIGLLESGAAEGFEPARPLFNRLHRLTLEGLFSDPYHGGNRDFVGWDLIGYPGAVLASTPDMQGMGKRLAPLHTSAYGADYDGD